MPLPRSQNLLHSKINLACVKGGLSFVAKVFFLSIKTVTEAGEYDFEDTRVSVVFFLPYADLQSVQSVVFARFTNCMSVIAVIFMYI